MARPNSRRREEIQKKRPDADDTLVGRLLRPQHHVALLIVIGFAITISGILMLRPQVVGYRVGQYVPYDIVARVDFDYHDEERYTFAQMAQQQKEPRVYKAAAVDPIEKIRGDLHTLPDTVKGQKLDQLPDALRKMLDSLSLDRLQSYANPDRRAAWQEAVDVYARDLAKLDLRILPDADRAADAGRNVRLGGVGSVRADDTYSPSMRDELLAKITRPADSDLPEILAPKVVAFTLDRLTPNFEFDVVATNSPRSRLPIRWTRPRGTSRSSPPRRS